MRVPSLVGMAACCMILASGGPAIAGSKPNIYATPQRLVRLPDGRRINMVCLGSGSPTVVLTAGAGDWSAAWSVVEAAVAKHTQVCAWDRPGFGFSDPSPEIQSAPNLADDLEKTLEGAGISAPYIMVAHSAGSFETLIFADRRPRAVVGMILVDPTIPDLLTRIQAISPMAATALRADFANRSATFRRCAAGPDQVSPTDSSLCFHIPDYAKPLARILAARDHDRQRLITRASLYEEIEANSNMIAAGRHSYGNMPLYILTSQREPLADLPVEQSERRTALNALWRQAHDHMAALSKRGTNRVVDGTNHQVYLQKPDAVIAAINKVIRGVR